VASRAEANRSGFPAILYQRLLRVNQGACLHLAQGDQLNLAYAAARGDIDMSALGQGRPVGENARETASSHIYMNDAR